MRNDDTAQNNYRVLGIMSGTSLDGIDMALCEFTLNSGNWDFRIIASDTFSYTSPWKRILSEAQDYPVDEFMKLHKEYGVYLGQKANEFLDNYDNLDLIASHGHTIIHKPASGVTFQLGDGAMLAASTDAPVVSDFRNLDVGLGGQGAPLVPVGDELLFSDYEYCLNLGGFGNISYSSNGKRIAYDVCPVNYAINYLARQLSSEYDKDGLLAQKGNVDNELLSVLNSFDFYQKSAPKSLGREWMENVFFPELNTYTLNVYDKLRTIYEHIAINIGKSLEGSKNDQVLVTGGGAFNDFLIELLKKYTPVKIVLPSEQLIEYKEALIFAFLGVLRYREEINCLSSVTGAGKDHTGGCIYRL